MHQLVISRGQEIFHWVVQLQVLSQIIASHRESETRGLLYPNFGGGVLLGFYIAYSEYDRKTLIFQPCL